MQIDSPASPLRAAGATVLLLTILAGSAVGQSADAGTDAAEQPPGTPVPGKVVARVGDDLRIEIDPGQLTPEIGDLVTVRWVIGERVLDAGRAEVSAVSELTVTARVIDGKPNRDMDATIWVTGPEDAFQAGEAIFLSGEPDDWEQRKELRREAADWYLKAARAGHERAKDRLIEMWALRRGPGGHRDIIVVEAEEIFVEAARGGSATAQFALGITFLRGSDSEEGIPAKPTEALAWLRMAAAQGHPEALRHMGDAYQHAIGVPRDQERAHALYEEAIAAGSVYALYSMAMHLYNPSAHGASKGARKTAFAMLERAVDAGQCHAIEWLAKAYLEGRWMGAEVKKDEKKGLRMLQEGARADCPTIKYTLEKMGETW